MKLKDVSFYCIVLAIIVAMTLHHILNERLIEGNTNVDEDLSFTFEVDKHPEIELKNQEIETLRGEIDDLRDHVVYLKDNLSNSDNIIDMIEEEAAIPIEEDSPVDDVGSDIIDDPEIIFQIDPREHVYEITTCGKMGKDPPSDVDCNNEHPNPGSLDPPPQPLHIKPWFSNPSIYDYDENTGIHGWIVPKTGSYIIEAAGSSGGTIKDSEEVDVELKPGRGAVVKGIFYLKEGDKYNIIIGQMGTPPSHRRSDPWNGGAGAGGGTFMWKNGEISGVPLIVAGGGGGQGVMGHKISGYGGDGSLSEEGEMGPLDKKNKDIPNPTNVINNAGKDGKGGGDPVDDSKKSKGWRNIILGERLTGVSNIFESESGFGGGGIMQSHAGGGGGGYSGGGSFRYGYSQSNTMGGGGGGSYFNDEGFKREDSETLDYNEGDGYLKIKLIKEYFFVEGNKVRCNDYGGYEPSSSDECIEASETLGLEWKTGPRKNGWNNNNCGSNYSKCVWRDENTSRVNTSCVNSADWNKYKSDKGLIYNEKCEGMEDYETNGIDNIYKTICVSPIKALDNVLV